MLDLRVLRAWALLVEDEQPIWPALLTGAIGQCLQPVSCSCPCWINLCMCCGIACKHHHLAEWLAVAHAQVTAQGSAVV